MLTAAAMAAILVAAVSIGTITVWQVECQKKFAPCAAATC